MRKSDLLRHVGKRVEDLSATFLCVYATLRGCRLSPGPASPFFRQFLALPDKAFLPRLELLVHQKFLASSPAKRAFSVVCNAKHGRPPPRRAVSTLSGGTLSENRSLEGLL